MADPRFATDPPQMLRAVTLDDLTALYHRLSAQTHIVTEPVPDIIEALQARPDTAAGLLARLVGKADAAAAAALDARLAELEAIGLVHRV